MPTRGSSPQHVCTESSQVGGAAGERLEVGYIAFHELRHTLGTRMAASGMPLRTIQHWMGHADSKTTHVYAHYQPSDAEAEVVDVVFG